MFGEKSTGQIEQNSGVFCAVSFSEAALAVAASGSLLADSAIGAAQNPAAKAEDGTPQRKIKLGLVGCGGRGSWIAGLFRQHGGYEMHAVADYFREVADRCGEALGVDKRPALLRPLGLQEGDRKRRRGHRPERAAVFLPRTGRAAVEAGLHVYMAKPVAVDVPGCLALEAAGKLATQKSGVFLVDYQMPTDPANIEVPS